MSLLLDGTGRCVRILDDSISSFLFGNGNETLSAKAAIYTQQAGIFVILIVIRLVPSFKIAFRPLSPLLCSVFSYLKLNGRST